MNTCPTPPGAVDLRNPASCVTALNELLRAYYGVMSGQGRVTVRFQERWTEYQKGNVEQLRMAYMNLYAQCPGAAQAGLPDLSVSAIRRGGPARVFRNFDDRL